MKKLCAMHWVMGLKWVVAMRTCSFAGTLSSAALTKFTILSCVFVFLSAHQFHPGEHLQAAKRDVGGTRTEPWFKALESAKGDGRVLRNTSFCQSSVFRIDQCF